MRRALVALFVAAAAAPAAHAAPGDLDTSFGSGGVAHSALQGAADLVIDGSNRIVVVDTGDSFGLNRHLPDGRLDTAFGSGGHVVTARAGGFDSEQPHAAALAPDGKLVVIGTGHDATGWWAVVRRYTATGALDTSFGAGGRAAFRVGGVESDAYDVVVQPDGRIVVAVVVTDQQKEGWPQGLLRLLPDGSRDPSFGTDGEVVVAPTDRQWAHTSQVALAPGGRLLTTGMGIEDGEPVFATSRFTSDGRRDTTYGVGGTTFGPLELAPGTALGLWPRLVARPDGSAVLLGQTTICPGFFCFDVGTIEQLRPDGRMDPAFGVGGWVHGQDLNAATSPGATDGWAVTGLPMAEALASDGTLLVYGAGITGSNPLSVARYLPSGSLDRTFGRRGATELGDGHRWFADTVAIDHRGRAILVAANLDQAPDQDVVLLAIQIGRATKAASEAASAPGPGAPSVPVAANREPAGAPSVAAVHTAATGRAARPRVVFHRLAGRRLTVRVRGPCGARRCRGTARLLGRHRRHVLARRYVLRPGRPTTIVLRLSPRLAREWRAHALHVALSALTPA